MRGFLCGFLTALILGAMTIGLQGQVTAWGTGAGLMEWLPNERGGYVAGVVDTLAWLGAYRAAMPVDWTSGERDEALMNMLTRSNGCLLARSRGTLNQLREFAETQWRGRAESGADILIFNACK
jgi:hypothetical protein